MNQPLPPTPDGWQPEATPTRALLSAPGRANNPHRPPVPWRRERSRHRRPVRLGTPMTDPALPAHLRPVDDTPVHTTDLPATPTRDRNIPATAWVEAPAELLRLGLDLPGRPIAFYKRRIGRWLLWRAGPASGGDARYMAAAVDAPNQQWVFRLRPDGRGEGAGPSGAVHERFRAWKEDLRDHG